MRAFISTTIIGVFGLDESKKILFYKSFPRDSERIAEKLKLSEIEFIDEERFVRSELNKRGYTEVKKDEQTIGEFLKSNLRRLALEKRFVRDQAEFNQLLTKVNIQLTKVQIKKAIGRDNIAVDANGAIEELDKSINIFVERLREFYSMHFPEMDKAVENNEKFAKLVEKFGRRENIEEVELKAMASKSMGADFKDEDIRIAQSFATEINRLYKLRQDMSNYLEKLLKEIVPNFTELATPMLAAKLLTKAGGLERLSKMASSTIQLLGAEKALFRFLHSKGKSSSPRFGILYNHPLIQTAPEKHKGKIARALASKLSIAAKMDYYSKEYKADALKSDLEKKVKGILSSK